MWGGVWKCLSIRAIKLISELLKETTRNFICPFTVPIEFCESHWKLPVKQPQSTSLCFLQVVLCSRIWVGPSSEEHWTLSLYWIPLVSLCSTVPAEASPCPSTGLSTGHRGASGHTFHTHSAPACSLPATCWASSRGQGPEAGLGSQGPGSSLGFAGLSRWGGGNRSSPLQHSLGEQVPALGEKGAKQVDLITIGRRSQVPGI